MSARTPPPVFTLERLGADRWRWANRLLGLEQEFVHGDDGTLPTDPLRFIAPQVQDDLVLLDQREGALWADAGVVTAAADWSMRFDVGMSFLEVHKGIAPYRDEVVTWLTETTRAHLSAV